MLEIILIIVLAKKLAGIAEAKGRSKGWAALGPVLWILGEVMGGVAAGILGVEDLAVYGLALIGAAVGAGVAWAVVNGLSADPAYAGLQEGAVDYGFRGGNYDPTNPYNAPGTAPRQNANGPSGSNNPDSPFG